MAMSVTKPLYRGPPASPPKSQRKRREGPPPDTAFPEKFTGIHTKPAVYAQYLLQETYLPVISPRNVVDFNPANSTSGSGSGGSKEWSGPMWDYSFGGGNAVWNLLANAELMSPIGRGNTFKPDPNYVGNGLSPPQSDPMHCPINVRNVVDMEKARIKYGAETFRSLNSRGLPLVACLIGWFSRLSNTITPDISPARPEPQVPKGELDISAFSNIRTEIHEGPVKVITNDFNDQAVSTAADLRDQLLNAVNDFPVNISMRLYEKRVAKLSPNTIVILKPDEQTVRVVINKHGVSQTVLDMDEAIFYQEMEYFSKYLSPGDVCLEKNQISNENMDLFFCMCLKDNCSMIHSRKIEEPPFNALEGYPHSKLTCLRVSINQLAILNHAKNPMRLDWVNPPVKDSEAEGWALELKARDPSFCNYWYFRKDFEPKYVKVTNKLPVKRVVPFRRLNFSGKSKSNQELLYQNWLIRATLVNSNTVQQLLLDKKKTLLQLFMYLKNVEAYEEEVSQDRKYQRRLAKLSPLNKYPETRIDISKDLFFEFHNKSFIEDVKKTASSFKMKALMKLHLASKWLNKPLIAPTEEELLAESKDNQRALKQMLLKKKERIKGLQPISSLEFSSMLASEMIATKELPAWIHHSDSFNTPLLEESEPQFEINEDPAKLISKLQEEARVQREESLLAFEKKLVVTTPDYFESSEFKRDLIEQGKFGVTGADRLVIKN